MRKTILRESHSSSGRLGRTVLDDWSIIYPTWGQSIVYKHSLNLVFISSVDFILLINRLIILHALECTNRINHMRMLICIPYLYLNMYMKVNQTPLNSYLYINI